MELTSTNLIFAATFIPSIISAFNLDTRFPLIFSAPLPGDSYFGYTVGLLPNDQGQWLLVGAPRANSSDVTRKSVVEPGVIYKCLVKTNGIPNTECSEIPFHLADQGVILPRPYNYEDIWNNSWLGVSLDVASVPDPFVMACAHLWKNKYDSRNHFANGMCIIADSSLQKEKFLRLTPLTETGKQTQKNEDGEDIYKYGLGLTGLSSNFLSDTKDIVLGAPGVVDWKGTIIYADENGYRRGRRNQQFQIQKPLDSISPNSYFGYSLSSGSFFGSYEVHLVAGAPRDGPAGKVYIVDTPRIHDTGYIVRLNKEGQQMGEYFGGAVCAVDFNNDQKDDLLVGAPFHSIRQNEGKVYVYVNQEGRAFTPAEPLTSSSSIGAQFGSAIEAIGDLNLDGYKDVAVGAPYEDDVGAVYIYLGGPQGLKLNQKISASVIDSKLRGFGISISKGSDVDNNNYIDLAVGAYGSNNAVILRSYPVFYMKSDIQFDIEQINMHNSACSFNGLMSVCFYVTACSSYSSQHGPNTLDVENTLSLGEVSSYTEIRAFFKSGNDAVNEVKYNITMFKEENICNKFQVHVLNSTVDYLTPIKFSLITALKKDPSKTSEFCSNCPVMPADEDSVFVKLLPFATHCGKDDVCTSDLSVNVMFRGQSEKSAFIIGSSASIILHVEVKNSGEPAYQAKAVISLPKMAMLIKRPENCILSNLQLVCDVGNPLRQNRMASFDVRLDASQLSPSTVELNFEVHVNTTSKELNSDDNIMQVTLPLQSDADIVLIGSTTDEQILLQTDNNKNNNTLISNTTTIVHEFRVLKKGFTPINSVILTVSFPALQVSDEELVQIKSITPLLNKGIVLEDQCNVSWANGRDLHENIEFEPYTSDNLILECSDKLCYVIQCILGPFLDQEYAIISLEFDVNTKLIKNLLKGHNYIDFISKGSVKIIDSGVYQLINLHPDFAQVKTQFVKGGLPSQKQVEVWIIVVCILAGLLLLILIVAVMAKAGFFHRKEKEEMKKLTGEDRLLEQGDQKQNTQATENDT